MSDVKAFVSYRRQSSMHLARNIFTELNRRGIDTFLDVDSIDATQFDTFILNQINARSAFVLVLSKEALKRCTNEGDWLLREIEHAYKTNRNIIPIYDMGFDWEAEKHYLPEHLQQYLTLRNAVSYTNEYYHSFMDKIARFARHPQDHGEIEITPAPAEETEQAETLIREALQVRYESEDVVKAVGKFFELRAIAQTSTDYQDLLHLWSEVKAGGSIPDFFNLDRTEQETREALDKQLAVEAEIERRRIYIENRDRDYDFIRKLNAGGGVPRPVIAEMLQDFWDKYLEDDPLYDPDDISGREAELQRNLEQQARWTNRLAKWTASAQAIIGDPFDWCIVPAGEFLYGDNKQTLTLPDFAIAKYPITYHQYQAFIDAGDGFKDKRWWDGLAEVYDKLDEQKWQIDDHPRENVNWYQAIAFCRWLSHRLGGVYDLNQPAEWLVRLPTEFEWEKAARGTNGLVYPYGDEFDKSRCNFNSGGTTPVTQYPQGASPYGAMDLSGNVWEWCLTAYDKPEIDLNKQSLSSSIGRVLRGGSWYLDLASYLRSAVRNWNLPNFRNNSTGFRCVLSAGEVLS